MIFSTQTVAQFKRAFRFVILTNVRIQQKNNTPSIDTVGFSLDPDVRQDDRRYKQKRITLTHGAQVPLLGQTYQIIFEENRTKGVKQTEDKIIVSHPYNRHHMLLTMWLKQKSLHFLAEQSKIFADQLGAKTGRITVREVRSRWGSCSHQGNLSYSWRLIFAPKEVAEYVCAHEVSHLKQMNHSRAFWKTVESIDPDYKVQKDWLRTHGRTLFLFS